MTIEYYFMLFAVIVALLMLKKIYNIYNQSMIEVLSKIKLYKSILGEYDECADIDTSKLSLSELQDLKEKIATMYKKYIIKKAMIAFISSNLGIYLSDEDFKEYLHANNARLDAIANSLLSIDKLCLFDFIVNMKLKFMRFRKEKYDSLENMDEFNNAFEQLF